MKIKLVAKYAKPTKSTLMLCNTDTHFKALSTAF